MKQEDLDTGQIIVTGACGWLGHGFVNALCNNYLKQGPSNQKNISIRCLIAPGQDPSGLKKFSSQIEIISGDIRDQQACARLFENSENAILFHTAGIIHPKKISEFYEVNVEGTKNLLHAASTSRVQRAVVVSSNSPLGVNPHPDHLFDEVSAYNPYMNYGRSKMLMENEIKSFQDTGKIETVIIRAPWFYGPFQPPRQTLFFKMIRDGKVPIVGDGENKRSMVYIENLCHGLILAAGKKEANGEIYWIADKRLYSMNEIIDTIENVLETNFNVVCAHKRMRIPGTASEIAYFFDKMIQGLGFYHQKIHVLSEMNKTIACSIKKAETELGYFPKIDLKQGMILSMEWLFNIPELAAQLRE